MLEKMCEIDKVKIKTEETISGLLDFYSLVCFVASLFSWADIFSKWMNLCQLYLKLISVIVLFSFRLENVDVKAYFQVFRVSF